MHSTSSWVHDMSWDLAWPCPIQSISKHTIASNNYFPSSKRARDKACPSQDSTRCVCWSSDFLFKFCDVLVAVKPICGCGTGVCGPINPELCFVGNILQQFGGLKRTIEVGNGGMDCRLQKDLVHGWGDAWQCRDGGVGDAHWVDLQAGMCGGRFYLGFEGCEYGNPVCFLMLLLHVHVFIKGQRDGGLCSGWWLMSVGKCQAWWGVLLIKF